MSCLHYPKYEQTVNLQGMAKVTDVVFREATTCDDIRQVCALNHQTFAKELGNIPSILPVCSLIAFMIAIDTLSRRAARK